MAPPKNSVGASLVLALAKMRAMAKSNGSIEQELVDAGIPQPESLLREIGGSYLTEIERDFDQAPQKFAGWLYELYISGDMILSEIEFAADIFRASELLKNLNEITRIIDGRTNDKPENLPEFKLQPPGPQPTSPEDPCLKDKLLSDLHCAMSYKYPATIFWNIDAAKILRAGNLIRNGHLRTHLARAFLEGMSQGAVSPWCEADIAWANNFKKPLDVDKVYAVLRRKTGLHVVEVESEAS